MEYIESSWSAAASQVPEDVLLLNVETTGLRPSSSFVCMISAVYRKGDVLFSHTWLAGSRRDEEMLFKEIQKLASSFPVICTFGGNAFAFRFLRERLSIYSDASLFENSKLIDLQKTFRPLLRILPIDHLKKEDIEHFLGFHRHGVKTGKELISVYQIWERDKSEDARDSMLLHAREDVCFLCEACKLNVYLDFLQTNWKEIHFKETPDGILFHISLYSPVPAEAAWTNQYADFSLSGQSAQVLAIPFSGQLRYFLPGSCSDYYYLPAEDTAIHRSVAQFVDRKERVRATPETCYVNREGIFLPVPASLQGPLFHTSYRSVPAFTQFEKEKWQQDSSLAGKYLAAILQSSD